jgi:hypothetical protein
LWDPPGANASIYIDFDLVDRLGFEVMRGFGAVPKRGAEVGGILLGTVEQGERLVVRIEDFVAVECGHSRGPSYLLSEKELEAFDAELARHKPAPDRRLYAVGYYRSNTRDLLALGKDDLEILDSRFPYPSAVCLLVKPYATRVSEACILLRKDGRFPAGPPAQVFPFRRKELGGGKTPRRGPGLGDGAGPAGAGDSPAGLQAADLDAVPGAQQGATPDPGAGPRPEHPKSRASNWIWVPLSFIFLLLGVAIGFQVAATYKEKVEASRPSDPYLLDLSVVQFGDNLHLKWNLDAPVFRSAKRGLLSIRDGDSTKLLELQPEDLARGGVLYKNSTGAVSFRLEVFPREQTSVSETVEVQLAAPASK